MVKTGPNINGCICTLFYDVNCAVTLINQSNSKIFVVYRNIKTFKNDTHSNVPNICAASILSAPSPVLLQKNAALCSALNEHHPSVSNL